MREIDLIINQIKKIYKTNDLLYISDIQRSYRCSYEMACEVLNTLESQNFAVRKTKTVAAPYWVV